MFGYMKMLKDDIQKMEEHKRLVMDIDKGEIGFIAFFDEMIRLRKKHYRKISFLLTAMALAVLSLILATVGFILSSTPIKLIGNSVSLSMAIILLIYTDKPLKILSFGVFVLASLSLFLNFCG